MSKQSEAKAEQNYRKTPDTCSNCGNFSSELVPVAWMARSNADNEAAGYKPRYNLALRASQNETNLRCTLGGFAVKKTATCDQHVLKTD